MKEILYAPVIIPTLNRYEHFKRCLESLEQCTGAEKTEVYVALDFPPTDKYRKGWKQISEYLSEKERKNGFKQLHVIRRENNCGVGHSKSNGKLLVNSVKEKYETYIFTEDDNEFSPCFLEFMNKSFAIYKDDPRVVSISGYNQESFYVNGKKIIFVYDSSAWGIGRWTNKFTHDSEILGRILHSPRYIIKLWKTYPKLLQLIISVERHKLNYGDATNTAKCICEELYQVRPSLSLVRNLGNDGSGQHSGCNEMFEKQDISVESHFEMDNVEVVRTTELDNAVYNNMMPQSKFSRTIVHLRILASLCLYYITNIKI